MLSTRPYGWVLIAVCGLVVCHDQYPVSRSELPRLRCKQASGLERATLISHCSLVGSPVMDFSGRHYPKDLILQAVRRYP